MIIVKWIVDTIWKMKSSNKISSVKILHLKSNITTTGLILLIYIITIILWNTIVLPSYMNDTHIFWPKIWMLRHLFFFCSRICECGIDIIHIAPSKTENIRTTTLAKISDNLILYLNDWLYNWKNSSRMYLSKEMNVSYWLSLYLVPSYSKVMITFYIFPVGKNKLKLNPVKYENMLPHFIS